MDKHIKFVACAFSIVVYSIYLGIYSLTQGPGGLEFEIVFWLSKVDIPFNIVILVLLTMHKLVERKRHVKKRTV